MKFFAKMNEQLQYTWNFQLSMLSLKNGFHSHLLSSSILSPHQCFTPIPKLAATTSKKKKEKKKKTTNVEIQSEGEVACLIWKWKRTRECFWRIEDQPSMKSDVYTRLFFFFSLSLGNFQLYYSIGYWPNPYHRSPLDTLPCSFHKIKRRTKSFKQFQK